ncbi:MAG: hypothetical protein M5U26_19690 [Planctomycetota bacterium]|nr:hypothetical protein [Planctomycetota bacterium]
MTPPEELIHVSRLTDSALYYQNGNALKHKLVVLDEADSLTSEVIVALRVLKTRGALSLSHVQRDFASGGTRTEFVEARGPVAVLTSTAGKLDAQLLSRCYELPVDESPEQTARILDAQRRSKAEPGYSGKRGTIVGLHRNAMRLLECRPVVIPFAQRIEFPASSVRHRREQERFLALIEASALLHQHQRIKDGEFIVADARDFEAARRLASDSIRRSAEELSRNALDVLAIAQAFGEDAFTLNDLQGERPDWTRHKLRAGLDELLALEIVASPRRTRPRQYRLVAPIQLRRAGCEVTLKLPSDIGDLAAFGGANSPNPSQEKATG